MEKMWIFKLGGKILEHEAELELFLNGFSKLPGKRILIHGGGIFADDLAQRLDIPSLMHDGRRITTEAMRDLVCMVYGGLINKRLVAKLQALGCDALGLCGADGQLLRAQRRDPSPIDYGYVGDIVEVRHDFLEQLLNLGLTPVIAPLSWESQGEILNSNADTVACKVTEAMSERYDTYLFYCFDKPGVLLDINSADSLLASIDQGSYQTLKDQQLVSNGMLPKLDSCFRAKSSGARTVLLATPEQSLNYAFGRSFAGTLVG